MTRPYVPTYDLTSGALFYLGKDDGQTYRFLGWKKDGELFVEYRGNVGVVKADFVFLEDTFEEITFFDVNVDQEFTLVGIFGDWKKIDDSWSVSLHDDTLMVEFPWNTPVKLREE